DPDVDAAMHQRAIPRAVVVAIAVATVEVRVAIVLRHAIRIAVDDVGDRQERSPSVSAAEAVVADGVALPATAAAAVGAVDLAQAAVLAPDERRAVAVPGVVDRAAGAALGGRQAVV